jgi:hypothetical protein
MRLDLSIPSLVVTIGAVCFGATFALFAWIKVVLNSESKGSRKIPAALYAISAPAPLGMMGFLASTMVSPTLIYHGELMGGIVADYVWVLFLLVGLGCLLGGFGAALRYVGPGRPAIRLGLVLQLIIYALGISLFLGMHRNP